MHEQLPGRSTTVKELGPAGGVKKHLLRSNPVDVLLIEQTSHQVWKVWIEAISLKERPEAIVWFEDSNYLAKDSSGPMSKGVRKAMQKLGYQASFWHMRADDYSAAMVQGKV
jgi:hypothetical protein